MITLIHAYKEGVIIEPNKMIGVPHIVIKEGVTLNNVKFKPMLTACLEATYDDYVPNVASQSATTLSKVFSEFVNATQKTENDLKKSVSDGKTLLAEAITEKGIDTASTASFSTMAKNIQQIPTAGYGVSGYVDTTIQADGSLTAIIDGLYKCEINKEQDEHYLFDLNGNSYSCFHNYISTNSNSPTHIRLRIRIAVLYLRSFL